MGKKSKAFNAAMIGIMGALTALVSMISIPTPMGMPITLQFFAVSLCGFLLGSGKGISAVLVFLFLGCLGLPVFSGAGAGIGRLFSPTGGFLWSFPLLAFFCGKEPKGTQRTFWPWIGMALNYIVGGAQFAIIATGGLTLFWLFPYALKDAMLLWLARYVSDKILSTVNRI